MSFFKEFIRDNKELYDELGFQGLLWAWIKISFFLLINPVLVLLLYFNNHWIIGTIWLIPTILGLGITIGGHSFVNFLTNKFLYIRKKIYGE